MEFEDKRIAKRISLALNNKQIGGRKRSAYHYDLWSLKYLPKFKWDHLTEEINYQKAVREQKLVAEISAAKRERDFYLSRCVPHHTTMCMRAWVHVQDAGVCAERCCTREPAMAHLTGGKCARCLMP